MSFFDPVICEEDGIVSDGKTIFEGLYQIDWGHIRHLDGYEPNIPDFVLDLLSDDEERRAWARTRLFGQYLEEDGTLSDVTPLIVPFALDLLELDEVPERHELLWCLATILSDPSVVKGEAKRRTVRYIRNYAAVYALVEQQIPLLLTLLKHPDSDMRAAAAELLGTLNNSMFSLLPALIDQFNIETSYSVRLSLLAGIEDLFSHAYEMDYDVYLDSYSAYRMFLWSVMEQASSDEIRYKAACAGNALLRLSYYSDDEMVRASSPIAAIFQERFWKVYKDETEQYKKDLVLQKLCKIFTGVDALWQIIDDLRLNPKDIPLLLKYLLMAKFPKHGLFEEDLEYDVRHSAGGRRYQYLSVPHLMSSAKEFLQKIVDDDRFWKIPSNTFSFFLGLPDTRKGLRQAIKRLPTIEEIPF